MGYASVFRVAETGTDVKDVQAGDLRFNMGPHRSYQQADAAWTVPVPQGLAPEKAVLARLAGVSMTTLMTTAARPGERVVVMGLGSVGHLAAKVFLSCGYEVYGCDPDERRRKALEGSGARGSCADPLADAPSLKGTVALVLECSGTEPGALTGCRLVRKRGEVVLIGLPWKRYTDLSAHEVFHAVFHNYVVLRSGWEWEIPLHASDFRPHSIYGNSATALRWLAEGRIAVDGLCALAAPRDGQAVYQDILHRRRPELFTIFDWS
jgi:threonine dehydrogenase-like Zn-dependent dehydrogenase